MEGLGESRVKRLGLELAEQCKGGVSGAEFLLPWRGIAARVKGDAELQRVLVQGLKQGVQLVCADDRHLGLFIDMMAIILASFEWLWEELVRILLPALTRQDFFSGGQHSGGMQATLAFIAATARDVTQRAPAVYRSLQRHGMEQVKTSVRVQAILFFITTRCPDLQATIVRDCLRLLNSKDAKMAGALVQNLGLCMVCSSTCFPGEIFSHFVQKLVEWAWDANHELVGDGGVEVRTKGSRRKCRLRLFALVVGTVLSLLPSFLALPNMARTWGGRADDPAARPEGDEVGMLVRTFIDQLLSSPLRPFSRLSKQVDDLSDLRDTESVFNAIGAAWSSVAPGVPVATNTPASSSTSDANRTPPFWFRWFRASCCSCLLGFLGTSVCPRSRPAATLSNVATHTEGLADVPSRTREWLLSVASDDFMRCLLALASSVQNNDGNRNLPATNSRVLSSFSSSSFSHSTGRPPKSPDSLSPPTRSSPFLSPLSPLLRISPQSPLLSPHSPSQPAPSHSHASSVETGDSSSKTTLSSPTAKQKEAAVSFSRQHSLAGVTAPLIEILTTFLWPQDIFAGLAWTSKYLRSAVDSVCVWRMLYTRIWPLTCNHSTHNWKTVYLARMRKFRDGRRYMCTRCECTKAYAYKSYLLKHVSEKHPKAIRMDDQEQSGSTNDDNTACEGRKEYACPVEGCGAVYYQPNRLARHMRGRHAECKKIEVIFLFNLPP